ncbi:phosphatase PAP2 family protein [Hymenobacter convexus]|uniref:phosphatase PAP2 family protein n=1 Tax=Hymenobacter sp. CA1UV-4 TaxID=3063782 RepID=UPI0027123448|nr:phosphatase PAP2 family protein [Hymenobacter sp. CA1UV-4]MDO7852469.1 phosphatase PAP2 family protein [Hymenobacter sp. CA1UV-4]
MTSTSALIQNEHPAPRWLPRAPRAALRGLGWALPWLACLKLAKDIRDPKGFAPDEKLFAWLQAHRNPKLDRAATWLSHVGGPVGMGAVGLGLLGGLLLNRRRWQAGLVGTGMAGAWLLELAGKALLQRTRPQEWRPLMKSPIRATAYSFPSGHAIASAALATSVVLLLWPSRWRWLAVGLGAGWTGTMGAARVYLGAHYPSDALAGWLGSVGWVMGVYVLAFHPPRVAARRAYRR